MMTQWFYLSSAQKFHGLSSDAKPTDCRNGSIFIEIDTALLYIFNERNKSWVVVPDDTDNYNSLTNKPSINGVLLMGDKSFEDLGLSNPMIIKGRVDTVDDLPDEAQTGWLYLVGLTSDTNKDEYVYTTDGAWEYVGSSALVIDSSLSTTSVNPVQNKVIAGAINEKLNIEDAVGKNVTGTEYTIDGQTVTAADGAEIFNAYTGSSQNKATGQYSHAEGASTTATGQASHAEGNGTRAINTGAHAEGTGTTASGNNSHVEGQYNTASGDYAHAEGGGGVVASGSASHAEGAGTEARGSYSHAEGGGTQATGENSHAEGAGTEAIGHGSHAEGSATVASSNYQHVQGKYNVADANDTYAFIIGNGTAENARHNAFAIDWDGKVYVNNSADGVDVSKYAGKNVTGTEYTIGGQKVTAADGAEIFNDYENNKAAGQYSHSEGASTTATGQASHAEGGGTTASGNSAHAEGGGTRAINSSAHAEGAGTVASGSNSHAEGGGTTASGNSAHAEGGGTVASGSNSHAEGSGSQAVGDAAHAEGCATVASSNYQHVQGKYNVADANSTYAFIIGNGTAGNARHNAFAIDWDGKIYVNGATAGVDVSELDAAVSSMTKQSLGLGNVENKSSATIRGEITAGNISTSLGYVPVAANDLADTAVESFWENGYIDTSTHELVPSANQCTSGMIPTPSSEILVGCSPGYQIQIVWYKNGAYDTVAAYRDTPMRSWVRTNADHCRIMIRKSPTAATSQAEAAGNCFWSIPNSLEHSTTWASGSINGTTGAEASNSKRIRSSYMPIGTGIKITVPAGIKLLPIMYKDTTPTVEYSLAFQEGSFTMYPQKDTQYLRLVFGYTDDSEITDTGVHAQIRIEYIPTNKRWYALGDSITQGYRSIGSSIGVTPKAWVNIAAEITGLNLKNLGVGGSGYAIAGTQLDQKTAKDHVDDIDFSAADLVTLAYGVNDWKYDAVLGSVSSVSGDGTICGNMKYCIEKILDDNPLAKVVVLLPLNCWGTTKDYGDYSSNYGLGYAFEHSGTLEQVCNAMKQVAAFYGIEVIDLAHTSIVNRVTLPYCLDDGVHPNIAAHEQLGHETAARLSYMI